MSQNPNSFDYLANQPMPPDELEGSAGANIPGELLQPSPDGGTTTGIQNAC